MNAKLRDSLAQVVALCQKASPGAWVHRESKYDGDTYIVQAPHPTNHVLARYDGDGDGYSQQEVDNAAAIAAAVNFLREHGPALLAVVEDHSPDAGEMGEDSARLDYIERTFSGMTNLERYLPVTMIWGTGANGRTLREAIDKYMKRG